MADNIDVADFGNAQKTTRFVDIGGVLWQALFLAEHQEAPVNPAGGIEKYSVVGTAATNLDPPSITSRYCRLRIWHATQDQTKRLFYAQDNRALGNTGSDAVGYLVHGDVFLVKLATMTNFVMRAQSGETFEVFAEWLNPV